MRRTGYAELPLHPGHAPKWLFERMEKLAEAMCEVIVLEYGQEELLKRLSDPFWFQAFSCVLGFDWHSSGVTTVTCGAIKEALGQELGIVACGGKGKTSKKTPEEILKNGEIFSLSTKNIEELVYSSRMTAKVDSAAIQDGYTLYHHLFVFTEKGKWCVIQQGMNSSNKYARRYHWINAEKFVEEPHQGICCDKKENNVLDMTASQSSEARKISVEAIENIEKILHMPAHHEIQELGKRTVQTLLKAQEICPNNYEELLAIRGLGPVSVRALALIAQLIYGAEPSWEDPVKFSFTHGGKDGIPYPVDRETYDKSIDILKTAIDHAKLGDKDKLFAMRKLNEFL